MSRRANPLPVLTSEELRAVYNACKPEIAFQFNRMHELQSPIPSSENPEVIASNPYRKFKNCLDALISAYPNSIPTDTLLRSEHPVLLRAIDRFHGGIGKVRSLLYPRPIDLVPFVLLLAIFTRFNSETVLGLKLQDISVEGRLGKPVLLVKGYKGRSGRLKAHRRSFPKAFHAMARI